MMARSSGASFEIRHGGPPGGRDVPRPGRESSLMSMPSVGPTLRFAAARELVIAPKGTGWSGRHGISPPRSEEHTSELQSRGHLVCRLLLEKKKRQAPTPRKSSLHMLGG